MNTANVPAAEHAIGRLWLFIPALWLVVGITGFLVLSYWPQWFASRGQ